MLSTQNALRNSPCVLLETTGAAETWWTRQWSARWVQEHPAMAGKTCVGETSNVIPYWLHGDEIHYAVRGKSLVLSWGSRIGIAKSPWLSRFIFCIVPCEIMVKTVTLNQLLYYFSLSCKILLRGVMPERPLVGGGVFISGSFQQTSAKQRCCAHFQFAFSDLKGDMVFLVQALGWQSFSAVSCCPLCLGSKTHVLLNYKIAVSTLFGDSPLKLTRNGSRSCMLLFAALFSTYQGLARSNS